MKVCSKAQWASVHFPTSDETLQCLSISVMTRRPILYGFWGEEYVGPVPPLVFYPRILVLGMGRFQAVVSFLAWLP